jgi:hypothetical protein
LRCGKDDWSKNTSKIKRELFETLVQHKIQRIRDTERKGKITNERNGKGRLRECKSMKFKMMEGDYLCIDR